MVSLSPPPYHATQIPRPVISFVALCRFETLENDGVPQRWSPWSRDRDGLTLGACTSQNDFSSRGFEIEQKWYCQVEDALRIFRATYVGFECLVLGRKS